MSEISRTLRVFYLQLRSSSPERLDGEIERPLLNKSAKYEHELVEKDLISPAIILFNPLISYPSSH